MRHPTAKLSSVRGSTIAPRSIPARLASDTNSRALDWQVRDTVIRPTPVGTTLPPPTSLFCSPPNRRQAHSQCLFTETGRLYTGFDKVAASGWPAPSSKVGVPTLTFIKRAPHASLPADILSLGNPDDASPRGLF